MPENIMQQLKKARGSPVSTAMGSIPSHNVEQRKQMAGHYGGWDATRLFIFCDDK